MTPEPSSDVTELLVAWRDGDRAAFDRLVRIIYSELATAPHPREVPRPASIRELFPARV